MKGIWLPIITPFKDDKIDYESYSKLLNYYISEGINGIIPIGTTGESPTIDEEEKEELLFTTLDIVNHRVPIFWGLGSNNTRNLIKRVQQLEGTGIDGILSVCPYYNRPSQEGIYEHFHALSESTDLNILLYNIPYRTGRNIENKTIHQLARHKNIIGIKDACGDFTQSSELLLNRPDDFSILSGEDYTLFSSLALGADGGISASAHINTKKYLDLIAAFNANDLHKAKKIWSQLSPIIPYLFKEPNPAPIKYILNAQNQITSDEVRLPLTSCSKVLRDELNHFMASYSRI